MANPSIRKAANDHDSGPPNKKTKGATKDVSAEKVTATENSHPVEQPSVLRNGLPNTDQDVDSSSTTTSPLTPLSSAGSLNSLGSSESATTVTSSVENKTQSKGKEFETPSSPFEKAVAFVKETLSNAFEKLPRLTSVFHKMGYQREDGVYFSFPTQTVRIEDAFPSSPETMKRIAKICTHRGSKYVKNLALLDDPKALSCRGYIYIDKKHLGRFFGTGIVQYSSVTAGEKNRQICIRPFSCLWERGTAMLGIVLKTSSLYFTSFRGGITFATQWNFNDKSSTPARQPASAAQSSKSFVARLPWDTNIPVYDGTHNFNLSQYELLPRIAGEVAVGSTVMVIFTAFRYDLAQDKRDLYGLGDKYKDGFALNALAVILLATKDPESTFPDAPITQEESYGVIISQETPDEDKCDDQDDADEPDLQLM